MREAKPAVSSLPAAPAGPSIDQKVEAEMTRLLFRSAGFGLFSNFVLAILLVAGSTRVFPASVWLPWLGAIVLVSLARIGLHLGFQRSQPPPEKLPEWRRAFITGLAVSGLIWGGAGWIFFQSAQVLPALLLIFIIAGLNAGAARSLASVPLSSRIYVIATVTPLLLRFTLLPDGGGWLLAGITVTYAL